MKARTTCPDCDTVLVRIVIRDKSHHGLAPAPAPLEYELPDEKRSAWTGLKPAAGTLSGRWCPDCGRVLFYAEPKGG